MRVVRGEYRVFGHPQSVQAVGAEGEQPSAVLAPRNVHLHIYLGLGGEGGVEKRMHPVIFCVTQGGRVGAKPKLTEAVQFLKSPSSWVIKSKKMCEQQ